MNHDDERVDRHDDPQRPAPFGEQAPRAAPQERVLQAAETVRRIVEGEPQ